MGIRVSRGSYVNSVDDPNHPLWIGGDIGFDTEFNGTSSTVPTPGPTWTWADQSTATYVEKFGRGSFSYPNTAGNAFRSCTHSMPGSAPWTLTAKMAHSSVGNSGPLSGIGFTNGTAIGVCYFASAVWIYDRYTNRTTYGSAGASVTPPTALGSGPPYEYWRVVYASSSSIKYQISTDGMTWVTLFTETGNAIATPTGVGIFMNANSFAGSVSLDWWRIRSGSDTP